MAENRTYWIGGVKVHFPGKPYPSQFLMMEKIIRGLDRSQNCLLESPTGSGKSLALLCSSLAWLKKNQEIRKKEMESGCEHITLYDISHDSQNITPTVIQENYVDEINQTGVADETKRNLSQDSDDFKPAKRFRVPNDADHNGSMDSTFNSFNTTSDIHSTINENLNSLQSQNCDCSNRVKRLPKIYFGTRTHKQITQIIRELKKTDYRDVKMTILSSRERTCIHPMVSQSRDKNDKCSELLEAEGCQFYANTKKLNMDSLMAHNGFKEAWDIEDFVKFGKQRKICPYYKLRDLKDEADIIFCPYNYLIDPSIRDSIDIRLDGNVVILDEAHNIEDSARSASSFVITSDQLKAVMDDFEKLEKYRCKSREHDYFTSKCSKLSGLILRNSAHLNEYNSFEQQCKTWTGQELVAMLKDIGLGPEDFIEFKNRLSSLNEEKEKSRSQESYNPWTISNLTFSLLIGLRLQLHFLYKDSLCYVDDFRVAILRTVSKVKQVDGDAWLSKHNKAFTLSLNLWCLNPAVAFSELRDIVHSLVLTSGTLSPMVSFQSELGMPFQIQLEANHVIKDSQVWIGTLGCGPHSLPLNATFKNSETYEFQDEVGALVLDVCKMIRHGVLCFLPSYGMLDKLHNRWNVTGLYDEIETEKRIVVEPKSAFPAEFDEIMAFFYSTVRETKLHGSTEDGQSGAIFFAVCRGKVSEGLDFADDNARAVITIGIPFPSIKDVQVELKKSYNNSHCKQRSLLTGHQWYEIQAFRALNQALGRCIRHKSDWGAIILVDERLGKNKRYLQCLSKWVRQRVSSYTDYNVFKRSLKQFSDHRSEIDKTEMEVSNLTVEETTIKDCESDRRNVDQNSETSIQSLSSFSPNRSTSLPLCSPGRGFNDKMDAANRLSIPSTCTSTPKNISEVTPVLELMRSKTGAIPRPTAASRKVLRSKFVAYTVGNDSTVSAPGMPSMPLRICPEASLSLPDVPQLSYSPMLLRVIDPVNVTPIKSNASTESDAASKTALSKPSPSDGIADGRPPRFQFSEEILSKNEIAEERTLNKSPDLFDEDLF